MLQQLKLIKKENLTDKVFKLVFKAEKKLNMKPGQFITFLLNKIGGRAYSILEIKENNIVLIIKKRELKNGGRGGSKLICELNIGDELKSVGPAGHFNLQETNNNKLFIGTGTGFVPLYNMILGALNKNLNCDLFLTFGVKTRKDLFYLEQLKKLKKENKNFDFAIYISREKDLLDFELEHNDIAIYSGYTTNYLTPFNMKDIEEVYICGAPGVITGTVQKLEKIGFNKENVFYEKY